MKKSLIVLLVAAAALSVAPLVSLAGGSFYIDSVTGFVGIGNTTPASSLDVSGAMYSRLVTASSTAIDWNAGNVQTMTLSSSPTLTFSNGQAGGEYKLILNQDSTGGRTVMWPSSVKWAGGSTPTLSTTANAIDIVSFVFDGTSYLGIFTSNFTVLPSVKVEVWGAGGGSSGRGVSGDGGFGGGGGAYSQINAFPVANGTSYSITVGIGGTGGISGATNGTDGGDSWFNNTSTVLAKGGGGNGSGAFGGSAASGVGDTKTSGGNGGNVITGFSNDGSGGGGSGGDTTNGGNGGDGAPGTGGSGGTAGTTNGIAGATGSVGAANGASGSVPGGGASGAGHISGNGNSGGNGEVVITAPIGIISSATGGTHTTAGGYDIWTFTSSGTWTPSF